MCPIKTEHVFLVNIGDKDEIWKLLCGQISCMCVQTIVTLHFCLKKKTAKHIYRQTLISAGTLNCTIHLTGIG